jgi:hypothetical protein
MSFVPNALSDHRIKAVDSTSVTYQYKPKKSQRVLSRTVSGEAFVKSFAQHILPTGFRKVRYYGWMASCRRQRSIQHDDARLRTLEIDVLELSAELAGIRGDLPAAAEQYRNALDTSLKGLCAGVAPSVFFTKAVFAGSIKLDGMIEPGPFCSYLETHLRLADVLRRVDRPYEAEAILGECRNVTVPVVAERTNALRYRIADVNSWVLAAELLAERRPADAETAFRRARQLWTNNIQQFPHAKLYVSGTYRFSSSLEI